MNMKLTLAIVLLTSASSISPSSANAERAWNGSISFVDVNMEFEFRGLEYGYWADVGYLAFPGTHTHIGKKANIYFMLLPDQDDPLRSTVNGTIRLEVDGKKTELQKLVFVRSRRHANRRIDPEIIKRLEDSEKEKREAALEAKAYNVLSPTGGGGCQDDSQSP